jgi:hypothetical protein
MEHLKFLNIRSIYRQASLVFQTQDTIKKSISVKLRFYKQYTSTG